MPDFFEWLDEVEPPRNGGGVAVPAAGEASRYAQVALGHEVTELIATGEGARNDRLNQAAFSMGQLIGGGEIDEGTVRHTLETAARGIGLSGVEIDKTIASGLKAGLQTPRSPVALPGHGAGAPVPEATEWEPDPPVPHGRPERGHPASATPRLEPVEDDSWGAVDLGPFLDGSYRPPVPTLMPRADGYNLIYPGLVHSFYGESESGKSWIAQAEAARLIALEQRVLIIDFESDPGQVIDRLLLMGASPEAIREFFEYRRPDQVPTGGQREILQSEYAMVVMDGVTEALGIFGKLTKDNDDIASWMRSVPRKIARYTGAAVVLIDHVTKDAENRGRYAVGGQHKLNAIDGAAYMVDVLQPSGVGMRGEMSIRIAKDRPGQIRAHCGKHRPEDRSQEAARFVLDATGHGRVGAFLEKYRTEDEIKEASDERVRDRMVEISEFIAANPEVNTGAIYQAVAGSRKGKRATEAKDALDLLVEGGWVEAKTATGNAKLHRSVRPYSKNEDPKSRVYAPVTEWEQEEAF